MSLLESQLRQTIARSFSGKLLSGTITKRGSIVGTDAANNPIYGPSTTGTFQGITSNWTTNEIVQLNVQQGEAKILVILGLATLEIEPRDTLTLRGIDYEVVERMKQDTANAAATYRCKEKGNA